MHLMDVTCYIVGIAQVVSYEEEDTCISWT
jgi:hypothetical protein